ncbi:hypothetical protein DVH05_022068 [Phytophthora capsici]|nr:hypothetical protein DVH05_022068 [Phytophthora capsici]
MLQRLQFLEIVEFCDQKKFEASDGDLLSLHFETTPIPEAQNVKTIVDALQSFAYRIDINISNAVGGDTIRENSEGKRESPVFHHRLVTTCSTEDLTQIESNNIAFTEYWPATLHDNAYGLLVCDTVDEDELFPYRPLERVRHDLNMIAMASWRMGKDGKPVVLLSRWWRQRIRKSRAQFPPSVDHFRRNVNKLDAAMLSIARNAAHKT